MVSQEEYFFKSLFYGAGILKIAVNKTDENSRSLSKPLNIETSFQMVPLAF
jgi:hypothetical protein